MNRGQLKEEFEKNKGNFDSIKVEIEKSITKIHYSKCEYYEVFPFSYQRFGFKRGKLIENMNKIKTTKDLCVYGFNNNGNIIEVKDGIEIENQFNYQFLFYENTLIKSIQFDNGKVLQNIAVCYLDHHHHVINMIFQGRRGGREEEYLYSKNGILEAIFVKQFDRQGNEAEPYKELFEYDSNKNLKRIIKSFDNGYSEVIYMDELTA